MVAEKSIGGPGLAKHVIVISMDALSQDNWQAVKDLPNLSRLIKDGVYSTELKSVFPTLTYVAHTTMVTGVYPDKHGIVHNNPLQPFVPETEQDWYWYQRDIKVPTIYQLAEEKGLKTAGLLWPVTGKANIRYNLPEIKAVRSENQAIKVFKNGNPLFCAGLELKLGKYRKGTQQPYLDDFTTKAAINTIKRKKPNLLLIHLIDLDDAKHSFRTDSKEVQAAIERMDKRLGEIIKAVEDTGISQETTYIVIGDHGQFNVDHKIYLNNLLVEKGLIYRDGEKWRWRAYLQSCGGSAYLHVKENDREAEALALETLEAAIGAGTYGIEQIYHREQLDLLHAGADIQYAVEAKVGYSFDEAITEETVVNCSERGIRYATHGYSPEKPEYKCVLIAAGAGIKQNFSIGPLEMVDIAPTIAHLLGLTLNAIDGNKIQAMIL